MEAQKILLVDDDQATRSPVARILKLFAPSIVGTEVQVEEASGVKEVIARLEAGETFDAVLTDLQMPDGTPPEYAGVQVVGAVRNLLTGTLTGIISSELDDQTDLDPKIEAAEADLLIGRLESIPGIKRFLQALFAKSSSPGSEA